MSLQSPKWGLTPAEVLTRSITDAQYEEMWLYKWVHSSDSSDNSKKLSFIPKSLMNHETLKTCKMSPKLSLVCESEVALDTYPTTI